MNITHRLLAARVTGTPNMVRRLAGAIVVTAMTGSVPLIAHDMWSEPTKFSPAAGDIIGARLRVGQDMLGDPLPRSTALINEFVADDGHGRRPLVGRDGTDPAGLVRVAEPGLLVSYFSNPSSVELTAQKFDTYLKREGLDAIAACGRVAPTAAGSRVVPAARRPGTSGPADVRHGDRDARFTLELLAERNPYTLAAGQELPVRLTYQGRPLPGALVVAMDRTASSKLTARSDKDGRVRFRLPHAGMWMVKAVHMIAAQPDAQADWQSYWASLTFDLPGSAAAVRPLSH